MAISSDYILQGRVFAASRVVYFEHGSSDFRVIRISVNIDGKGARKAFNDDQMIRHMHHHRDSAVYNQFEKIIANIVKRAVGFIVPGVGISLSGGIPGERTIGPFVIRFKFVR